MTQASLVQVGTLATVYAANGPGTSVFGSNVTAGNCVVVVGVYGNVNAANAAAIIGTLTDSLGNTYTKIGEKAWDFEPKKAIGAWYAVNILGGANTVSIPYTLADSSNISYFVAMEFTNVPAASVLEGIAYGYIDAAATSVTTTAIPTSGVMTTADCIAILVSSTNNINDTVTDVDWDLTAGYTSRAEQNSAAQARLPLTVQTKELGSSAQITGTISSQESSLYGRVGMLVVIRGDTAAVTKYVKVTGVQPDAVGATVEKAQVFANPAGSDILGASITTVLGASFEATPDVDGNAVLLLTNATINALATGLTVKVVARTVADEVGFVGEVSGIVVEV